MNYYLRNLTRYYVNKTLRVHTIAMIQHVTCNK